MKTRTLLLVSFLTLLAFGCSTHPQNPLAPSDGALVARSSDGGGTAVDHHGEGAAQVTGQFAGALYALYRPAQWNGDLVLLAHGFIPPGAPIALPSADNTEAVRDSLLARRFAVAYSSYAENGYAVRVGAQNTEQLILLFATKLGAPRRLFLMGVSLGGQVVQLLAERHPFLYSGALTLSGVMGGTRRELDYVATVRVLFDYFYPGVLPGDLLHLPPGLDLNQDIIGPAVAAMVAHPEGAFALSQLAPVPFADGNELVASIVQALVLHTLELDDLLARTHGQSFFDNADVVYSGPLPQPLLDDLNAHVARYHIGPAAAVFMTLYYEPTGRLRIPLLSLHTSRDPVVPVFHEDIYRERVAAAGSSQWLEQRIDDRYGHVGYTPEQVMAAFIDLVHWADTSRRPPWLDRASVVASTQSPAAIEWEIAKARRAPEPFIR